jgi:hypothetical protein
MALGCPSGEHVRGEQGAEGKPVFLFRGEKTKARQKLDLIGKTEDDGTDPGLRDALPRASFIGFTGTPIEKEDRSTRNVFGNEIDIYDIKQAVDDGATVPISYESRLVKIKLNKELVNTIDYAIDEIVGAIEKLESLNYKTQMEGAFFFHPFVYWRQIVTISKYYTWNTSQIAVVRDGNFGKMDASRGLRGQIYGIPVYTSTNVVKGLSTYRNLLAVPAAFGFAIQTGSGKIRVQSDYLLTNLGTLTVADIIYGVGVLREPAAVLVNSNDTAITS